MLDINYIRENYTEFDNFMKNRGLKPCSENILKIDEEKRNTQTILENLLSERNNISKNIGELKKDKKDVSNLLDEVEKLKDKINNLKELQKIKEDELNAILHRIPNITSKDTPIGSNENDNIEVKKFGEKPNFNFKAKNHHEIGEKKPPYKKNPQSS